MESLRIVEEKVSGKASASLRDCLVAIEVDLPAFDQSPQPIHKDGRFSISSNIEA